MYIADTTQKRFIQQRLEPMRSRPSYAPEFRRHILERLTAAETLERYLGTKYVGQKRFSAEGGDTMIPMLDHLIQKAGAGGVQEMVIGMAHRGRLNVLVNTLGKMPTDLFAEFEGRHEDDLPAGDVKYHQGFSSDVVTPGGPMHLTLAFNPSHLEIVDPVVEGSVRARQDRRRDPTCDQVMPVLIHGDAAIAGQGVVQETLNLSQTRGYRTGGTIHIVDQQPDRLHHIGSARHARHALLHRRRQDGRGADTSTSTATIPRPACWRSRSRSSSGRSSTRTSSSTSSASAGRATTRPTSR